MRPKGDGVALALEQNLRELTAPEQTAAADAALAQRAARGDEQAFERIMRANNRRLYRAARSIVCDDSEAEDVLQEAYVKAYYALPQYKGDARLSTWLTRIVINEALQRKRKLGRSFEQHFSQAIPDWDTCADAPLCAPPSAGPEGCAMQAELGRLLQNHIERLPDNFRTVFVLRALEELSVEETAQCLNIPAATVRTRYLRARRQLSEHAARDIEAALGKSFPFGGAHCDRTVQRVLQRIRNLPPPSS